MDPFGEQKEFKASSREELDQLVKKWEKKHPEYVITNYNAIEFESKKAEFDEKFNRFIYKPLIHRLIYYMDKKRATSAVGPKPEPLILKDKTEEILEVVKDTNPEFE